MPFLEDFIQIPLFLLTLVLLTPLLGGYLARVYTGQKTSLTPIVGSLERFSYSLIGIDPSVETTWKRYAMAVFSFNLMGFLVLFCLQIVQSYLPLNPQHASAVSWHLAFNTAVSFVTNTNWQSYAGETALSTCVQMLGLTVQNFVSAATGIAVMLALIRGLSRKTTESLGNFWVDVTRSILYVFLPLSLVLAVVLVLEGSVQSLSGYATVTTLEGQQQSIPLGPVASQIAIKQLGTNGGGFFNANGAHPFENPTPVTNVFELLAILLLPASFPYTFGKMVGSTRQGWVLWGVMMMLFLGFLSVSLWSEYQMNPVLGVSAPMEGKEMRFGVTSSVMWSVATTSASNGSINAMHDSFSPLSGMVLLLNIMLGEIVFGGVGSGLYGMLMFVVLTVFMAGLMVGRSPEYLGKKIEAFDVKMAALAVILPSAVILVFSALGLLLEAGREGISNPGPHGLTQVLYAFSSAAGNNGSAFAGLNANTPFYNVMLGFGMLAGRYGVIFPVLALAGSLSRKNIVPMSSGTFQTDTPLFGVLVIGVVLIIGALTFFPSLAFGPVVEHLTMLQGRSF